MNVSKKLKQLMKILLVVFMSFTVIVPDGLIRVEAAGDSLTIDKEQYEIGDPVFTTASSDDEGAWVGFYIGDETASKYYYYVKDHNGETVNIFDTVLNDGSWADWNFGSGNYTVKLVKGDGTVAASKSLRIVTGSNPESITVAKSSFGATDPVVVKVVAHEYERPWIDVREAGGDRVGWFYINLHNGVDIDLRYYTGEDFESGKTYEAIFYKDYAGNEVGRVQFTAEPASHKISVDVEPDSDRLSKYKYGESVYVTAESSNLKAEVRLYDYDAAAEHGYGDDGSNQPYAKFKVHETEQPVDIIALAKQNGFDILPGKYRRYLILPTPANPHDITGFYMSRIQILETYDDENPEWEVAEDNSKATLTLKRVDDETKTVSYEVPGEEIVIKKPTCTEKGTAGVSFTFTFPEGEELVTVNDTKTFTKTVETGEIKATGHKWGAPTWKWVGLDSATAQFTCENDPSHVVSIVADVVKQTDNYNVTATATVKAPDGKEYTDVKTGSELDDNMKFRLKVSSQEGEERGSVSTTVYNDYHGDIVITGNLVNENNVKVEMWMHNVGSLGVEGLRYYGIDFAPSATDKPHSLDTIRPLFEALCDGTTITGKIGEDAVKYSFSKTSTKDKYEYNPDSEDNARAVWHALFNDETIKHYTGVDDSKITITKGSYLMIGEDRLQFEEGKDDLVIDNLGNIAAVDKAIRDHVELVTEAGNTTVEVFLDKGTILSVGESKVELLKEVKAVISLDPANLEGELAKLRDSDNLVNAVFQLAVKVLGEVEGKDTVVEFEYGHKMTKTEKVAPTCTEDGTEEYWTCEICGRLFSDEAGEKEIEEPVVIPATGHDWNEPVWSWDGYEAATAKFVCKNDETHVEEVEATVEVESDGYTATATATVTSPDGKEYTDTKSGSELDDDMKFRLKVSSEEGDSVGSVTGTVYNDYHADIVITGDLVNENNVKVEMWMHNVGSLGVDDLRYYNTVFAPSATDKPHSLNTIRALFEQLCDGTTSITGKIDDLAVKYTFEKTRAKDTYYVNPDSEDNARAVWHALFNEETIKHYTGVDDSKITITKGSYLLIGEDRLQFEEGKDDLVIDNLSDITAVNKAIRDHVELVTEEGNTNVEVFLDKGTILSVGESKVELLKEVKITVSVSPEAFEGELAKLRDSDNLVNAVFQLAVKALGEVEGKDTVVEFEYGHKMTKTEQVNPTCTEEGTEEYWTCEICGRMFSDEAGEHEIEEPVAIEALGHNWGQWTHDEGKETHTRVCGNDPTHKETEACTFTETIENGVATYTCSVCGYSYEKVILAVDKEVYKLSDPVMVTWDYDTTNSQWIGLYKKGENPSSVVSIYWTYLSSVESPFDILNTSRQRRGEYGRGEYTVVLFKNSGYDVRATVDFKVEVAPSVLEIEKKDYNYGEAVTVHSESDYPGAWVGLYEVGKADPLDKEGYLLDYYYVSANDEEGNNQFNKDGDLPVGHYLVILFTSGWSIDEDAEGELILGSFYIDRVYEEPTWIFNEDNSEATATFKPTDPAGEDYVVKAETTKTVTDATCTEKGKETYTATVDISEFLKKERAVTASGETEFTGTNEVEIPALGHDLVHHEAAEATCEKDGNKEYWECSRCGKLFSDKDGKTEVKKEDVVIAATGHNWGEPEYKWSEDNSEVTATRICKNDKEHVETETVKTTAKVTKEATCEEKGETTYTAEFKNEAFKKQEKTVADVEAIGHKWNEPEWKWNEDKNGVVTAVATFICANDPKHVVEEKAEVTSTVAGNKVTHEAVVKGPDGKEYKAVVDTLRGDVLRIFGSNRYETGMKVADFLTELQSAEKFDHIVLTTGLNFPDALSGAYLANTLDAPILLIRGDATTTAAVQKYIKEHLNEDGEILVLGGANAVKEEWLGDLGKQFKVSRVAGDNRYLTNIDILNKVDYRGGDILVCTGLDYADSLSGSAVDMPILLVKDALTKEQTDYLSKIKGAKFHIVGGTNAVSAAVEKELAKYGEVVERFAGKNRYETSTLLAEAFFNDAKQAVLAYGVNFPDGLCGGVIAAKMGAPLIVTISDDRKSFAVDYCADRLIKSGVVLGGSGLIDDIAVRKIFNMNAKDEIVIYERE